jgi:hypothetical protein
LVPFFRVALRIRGLVSAAQAFYEISSLALESTCDKAYHHFIKICIGRFRTHRTSRETDHNFEAWCRFPSSGEFTLLHYPPNLFLLAIVYRNMHLHLKCWNGDYKQSRKYEPRFTGLAETGLRYVIIV